MRSMIRPLLGALPVAMFAIGCAGMAPHRAEQDFVLTHDWAPGIERVEVRTINGRVEIRAADVPDVQISGTKSCRGHTHHEARELLDEIEVLAQTKPSDVRVLSVEVRASARARGLSGGASLVVLLPGRCSADVHTENGRIHAAGLEGEVRLETDNGSVLAADVDGRLSVRTSNGHIEVRRMQGACDLRTLNGRVEVEAAGGDVVVETSNGRVRADVDSPADARISLRTSNGRIELYVPGHVGMDLDARTGNGRVNLELDDAVLRRLDAGGDHLRAEVNGGGCAVFLRTSNGGITISGR